MKTKKKTKELWLPIGVLFLMVVFLLVPYSRAQAARPQVAGIWFAYRGSEIRRHRGGGGGVTTGQLDVGSWTNIVQVAAGGYHTVGLKSDGTVVAVGIIIGVS